MPNPGAFHGSRKEFLVSKKLEFANSVTFGYTAELLGTLQQQYFKRYPIDLPHDEEPSAEHLAAVDDDAADPEIEEPDEKAMSPEDYKEAMAKIADRKVQVTKRRAQIKRWFIYQYMKDHDSDLRDLRSANPYQLFITKLRGGDPDKPRRKSAVNVWRKFHRERIDKQAKLRAERENVGRSGMASLRDKIAREIFEALPLETRKEWEETANEDYNQAIEEWKELRRRPVSKDLEDRQRAIQGLVRFAQPVLDAIADATGWKVSLFAGGPEPAQGGMLNIISVHLGTTTGDIKLTFGQSERGTIKKDFIPTYGAFLQKCYSPEECRSRALSELEGFVPLSDMELEGTQGIIHPLTDSASPAPESDTQSNTPSVSAAPVIQASVGITKPSPPSVVETPVTKSSRPSAVAALVAKSSHPSVVAAPVTKSSRPSAVAAPVAKPSLPSVVAAPVTKSSRPSVVSTPVAKSSRPSVVAAPVPQALVGAAPVSKSSRPTVVAAPVPKTSRPTVVAAPVVKAFRPSVVAAPVAPASVAAPAPPAIVAPALVVSAPVGSLPTPLQHAITPATPAQVSIVTDAGVDSEEEGVEDTPFPFDYHHFSPQPSPAPSPPPSPTSHQAPLPSLPSTEKAPPAPLPSSPASLLPVSPSPSSNPVVAALSNSVSPPVAPLPKAAHTTKRQKSDKENVKRLHTAQSPAAPTEDRRPRREVKKTAKALSIEEEMLKKNGKGKKHSCDAVEDPGASEGVPASKRLRMASKKKGGRV